MPILLPLNIIPARRQASSFNEVRQYVNFEIIKTMAALKIELAGLNTEIKSSGALSSSIMK